MRHGRWIAILCGILCATGSARASDAVDPRDALLDDVLGAVRARAYYAPRVDWEAAERTARATLRSTPGEVGLTAAIRGVLKALDDGHSFYLPPRPVAPDATTTRPAEAPRRIAGLDLSQPMPVLAVNTWRANGGGMGPPARQLRMALVDASRVSSCGLVLDFRGNSGGTMWPMVAGLLPLYARGVLQTWIDRDGGTRDVRIDGTVLSDGSGGFRFETAPLPAVPAPPRHLALVWGPRTASSGELTLLGFAGRADTRSFGVPSHGQTTSNWSTHLRNGGVLAVMSLRVRDRTGGVVDGALVPDEHSEDPIAAAQAWLASKCAKVP